MAAALPELSAAIAEANSLSQASALLFPSLRRHVPICRSALVVNPRHAAGDVRINGAQPSPLDPTWLRARGLDPITVMEPFATLGNLQPAGRVFRGQALGPPDDERLRWLRTVVREWLDVEGSMSVNLISDREHSVRLTVFDGEPPFSRTDERFLEGVAPLLCAGLRSVMLREKAEMVMAGLATTATFRDVLITMLHEDMSPAWASADFRARLQLLFGPFDGPLPVPILGWLMSTPLASVFAAEETRRFERVFTTAHETLRVRATRIHGAPSRRCILVELTPARRPERRARLAAAGLTPRETDVALLLPRGLTNGEMALLLGIREVTVKKHLRAAGDKLGSTGKLETLSRLTRLLAHPDWPESLLV